MFHSLSSLFVLVPPLNPAKRIQWGGEISPEFKTLSSIRRCSRTGICIYNSLFFPLRLPFFSSHPSLDGVCSSPISYLVFNANGGLYYYALTPLMISCTMCTSKGRYIPRMFSGRVSRGLLSKEWCAASHTYDCRQHEYSFPFHPLGYKYTYAHYLVSYIHSHILLPSALVNLNNTNIRKVRQ